MKPSVSWTIVVWVIFVTCSFFCYGSDTSELIDSDIDSSEDLLLPMHSSFPAITDSERALLESLDISAENSYISPRLLKELLIYYVVANFIPLMLNIIREFGIGLGRMLIIFYSLSLVSGIFCVGLIWKLFLSSFQLSSTRILSFIACMFFSLLTLGIPLTLLILESLRINKYFMNFFPSIYLPLGLPLIAAIAISTFKHSYRDAARAVINDLKIVDESMVSKEGMEFTLSNVDYETLLTKFLDENAPNLTSRILSDTYTKNFTGKKLLCLLPETFDHPCREEIFKSRRFRHTDEGVTNHKLAHAIVHSRYCYLVLKEWTRAGQLIREISLIITLKLFNSCF